MTDAFGVPTELGVVAVRVRGEGPLLVALHANPGDGRDFDAVAGPLAEAHTFAVLDWPGYGDSPAPDPDAVTAPALAGVLDTVLPAILKHTGHPDAVLVGNSVGGYAALRQALDHPERVRGLVLIAPGGLSRMTALTRAACRFMARPGVAARLARPLASGYTWRRTPTARAALRRAYAVRTDPARLRVYRAIWRSFADPAHDLRGRVGGLRMPVLLTWGWGDPVLPRLTDGRRAARLIPGATLRTFVSGHEPHAEVPGQWLAAVQEFLRTLTPVAH